MMKRLLITLMLCLMTPATGFADEASLGGEGGSVEILNNSDVQMQSEVVKIDVYPSGEWNWGDVDWQDVEDAKLMRGYVSYDITYVFRNTAQEDVEVKMGFPQFCSWCEGPEVLQDFKRYMKVDGEWALLDGAFEEGGEHNWKEKNWHTTKVTFPSGDTEIRNTYWTVPTSYKAGMRWFDYILETGASWQGSIESAEVIVTFHDNLTVYDVTVLRPGGYKFDRKNNRLTWHFKDLEPNLHDNIKVQYTDVHNSDAQCGSSKTASSWLEPNGELAYWPCRAFDRNFSTAWVEGVEGDGIGEWVLDFIFPSWPLGYQYEALRVFNGYGVNEKLWRQNNRVSELKLTFIYRGKSEGDQDIVISEQIIKLQDVFGLQIVDLPQKLLINGDGVEPDLIKVEILSVYPGTKYDDTALTEFHVLGVLPEVGYEPAPVLAVEEDIEAEKSASIIEEGHTHKDLLRPMTDQENEEALLRMRKEELLKILPVFITLFVMAVGFVVSARRK